MCVTKISEVADRIKKAEKRKLTFFKTFSASLGRLIFGNHCRGVDGCIAHV